MVHEGLHPVRQVGDFGKWDTETYTTQTIKYRIYLKSPCMVFILYW